MDFQFFKDVKSLSTNKTKVTINRGNKIIVRVVPFDEFEKQFFKGKFYSLITERAHGF